MPSYMYRTDEGIEWELSFPMGRQPKCAVIRVGKRYYYAYRNFRSELIDRPDLRHAPGGWPLHSEAIGVGTRPGDIKRAEKHSLKIGVPTEFDKRTGKAILRSRKHRNAYMKACGFRDRDAGYGDYSGS